MKHLIIGSGAMMIYMFLGAMKNLSEKGCFDDLTEISCASCGSLIGFFFVLFSGDMDIVCRLAFESSLGSAAKPNVKNFIHKFGFIDASKIEEIVVSSTGGKDPTFKELYDLNPIKLHIPAYDLLTGRTIYMSVDTTPHLKVTRAIRRSISVPFMFSPCIEDGCVYLDGSTAETSPYSPFIGKNDVFELRWRRNPIEPKVPKNVTQFIKLFVYSISESMRTYAQYTDFDRVDLVSSNDSLAYDFNMSCENKILLFNEGYSQMVGMNSH